MIPFELKVDKEGLLYTDDSLDIVHRHILLDNREEKNEYYKSAFYRFYSTDDYIIKRPITILNKRGRIEYKDLLVKLLSLQEKVLKTDFPIGYYKDGRHLAGLVVRYYKDGISLDKIVNENDINLLGKYYSQDEDNIHNLFLLFNEILSRLNEMFDNGIYYTDINTGNFVVNDNEIKVIDFDPVYVRFDDKDHRLALILDRYIRLINSVLENYQLSNRYNENIQNFNEARILTKKIENKVRIK